MRRRPVIVLAVAALALLVALPVLGAKPSSPPGQSKDKKDTVEVTLHGTIARQTKDGKSSYTLADGGTTYNLEAGPPWFFDAGKYPLDPYVGQNVTVVGDKTAGTNDVEVRTVDGKALRGEGKPPWAGGWKRVGERHPGWSQEKADRLKAKFGACFPPGQCKDKPGHAPDGSPKPD